MNNPRYALPPRLVLCWALILLLAACSTSQSSPTPTPTLEPGWTRYTVETGQTSLALPAGWVSTDADPSQVEARLNELEAQQPNLSNAIDAARTTLPQGVQFFAVDTGFDYENNDSLTTIIVIKFATTASWALDSVAAEAVDTLSRLSGTATVISQERITIDGGPAAAITYRLVGPAPEGSETIQVIRQYFLVRGQAGYSLSCAVPERSSPEYATICQSIATSFDAPEVPSTTNLTPLLGGIFMLIAVGGWLISMWRQRTRQGHVHAA